MIFRNKKIFMIGIVFSILFLLYLPYKSQKIEYMVFGSIGFIWSSILYVFAIFEYYEIDEEKITHVYRLGFKKDEAFWKDINRVFILPNRYFRVIRIDYGMPLGKDMVINSGVKGYKELIKIIIDKTRDNSGISIDKRLENFL